ncbi:DNA-directed RNA polymerase subunit omega [Nesterenkonia sp. MY13]|uniref:DNA-directed RNA polymerase subunit omega n=1 Tax=Nesterenkonia sedimenti TaxID=1463632 RepID=A0A7X8TKR4_9MICC|nr:DNA-directed RNA polymerase subunit omega [Nesterenkonia sedimenti]NLS10157.1 DNA-directed RNA polymerase subunit omega [Nesterenkonia sedimenti]
MTEQLEGIIDPPIDDLVKKAESKYALVLFAAKRARQINNYYAQLHEGLFDHIGPLVETKLNEKPLSIALREVNEDLLEQKAPAAEAA